MMYKENVKKSGSWFDCTAQCVYILLCSSNYFLYEM